MLPEGWGWWFKDGSLAFAPARCFPVPLPPSLPPFSQDAIHTPWRTRTNIPEAGTTKGSSSGVTMARFQGASMRFDAERKGGV